MVFKLPPNAPKVPDMTPKNFFIWGYTMHGKSYLASEFPNPLFVSTDGNAAKITAPSIDLRNIKGVNGKFTQNIVDQLEEIIRALSSQKHTYETLVVDVTDDFFVMIDEAVADALNVEYLGDIPHGRGWGLRNVKRANILTQLQNLPMNVIYISRYATVTVDGVEKEIPSLKSDLVNLINGVCDYNIQCKRIGKNYLRLAVDKRQNYEREHIKDERILAILDTVTNAFAKQVKDTAKPADTAPKAPKAPRAPKASKKEDAEVKTAPEEDVVQQEEITLPVNEQTEPPQEPPVEPEQQEQQQADDSVPFDVEEKTEADAEQIAKEAEEIEQYVKDNPPPKAPRTATPNDKPKAPRAPRAPRTK